MAINKNDFKNAEGNYEAKNALMDAVIDATNAHMAESASDDVHGIIDRFYNLRAVKYSSTVLSGIVIDIELANNGIYLLFVNRDNGLYLITTYAGTGSITAINSIDSTFLIETNGTNLIVDFQARGRGYGLYQLV